MSTRLDEAITLLKQYKQEQLIPVLQGLIGEEQDALCKQLLEVDYKQLVKSYAHQNQTVSEGWSDIAPIAYDDWNDAEKAEYEERGWELLRQGKVGAIVVAGGQGSRLGHAGPKGTMDIGLPSHKSLFQLQAERLLNLSRRAGQAIPWYIMTSPDNHETTEAFFKSHHYFGYEEADCYFFQQNVMPAMDHDGKLILSSPTELSLAPSGNGECFASLKRSGALADMKRRGLKWLFYYNVDNALIKVADPAFIGITDHHNHPIAAKVVPKVSPEEKVGVVCMKDNKPSIIEYTEMPEAKLQERGADGELTYGLANISIHMFSYAFIAANSDSELPYHVASKKIKYMNEAGELITPEVPNAYKLERFIFDFFPLAEAMTVVKVKREEEFAPVKNKDGDDSPQTAKQLVLDLHRKWRRNSKNELETTDVEISPLDSYAGEGING